MGIRVSHPFGSPFSYNAALSFLEGGDLERFHTTIYRPLGVLRRCHAELPRECVTTYPLRELIRLSAAHLPLGRWSGRRQGFVDWVTRNFDQTTARAVGKNDHAVYCYEDSASTTFERASELGVTRIYELPILHHREIQRVFEAAINTEPALSRFLKASRPSLRKMERKDRELQRANVIVVPATIVQQSVERFLKVPAKFLVVPYGCEVRAKAKTWSRSDQGGPLKLFFAGILGPRKGLHILFAALSKMPARRYHLTLAGRWEPGFREWLSERFPIDYEWFGHLPHAEIYKACRRSHVFVLPSLAEGFALVILEAMVSGIPVLTTDHAGAEMIEQGVDGWVIPAGQVDALQETLQAAMEHRSFLADMGMAARRKAEEWSWTRYRAQLRTQVSGALGWA